MATTSLTFYCNDFTKAEDKNKASEQPPFPARDVKEMLDVIRSMSITRLLEILVQATQNADWTMIAEYTDVENIRKSHGRLIEFLEKLAVWGQSVWSFYNGSLKVEVDNIPTSLIQSFNQILKEDYIAGCLLIKGFAEDHYLAKLKATSIVGSVLGEKLRHFSKDYRIHLSVYRTNCRVDASSKAKYVRTSIGLTKTLRYFRDCSYISNSTKIRSVVLCVSSLTGMDMNYVLPGPSAVSANIRSSLVLKLKSCTDLELLVRRVASRSKRSSSKNRQSDQLYLRDASNGLFSMCCLLSTKIFMSCPGRFWRAI